MGEPTDRTRTMATSHPIKIALLADAQSIHTQRWVTALRDAGIRIVLFSERHWDGSPVPVHYLPVSRRGRLQLPKATRQLKQGLREFRPDVIHAHYASHWGLYGALSRLHPFVVSVWGADVEVFGNRSWVNSRILRYIFNQADAITASSQYLAAVTARFTVDPITVIPFGIDISRFSPVVPNQGSEFRWVINKALEPVYGVDVILEAMKLLHDRGFRSWRGKILGMGSERQALMRRAQDLGLADRVEFLGTVSGQDLPQTLAWADMGLYPSRRESFGVAPLEMMALGRAVLAHRIGGLTEVVWPGVTGDFVESLAPGDWALALEPLLQNLDRVRGWGHNGPEWVRSRYNFEDNVRAMLDVYEQVLDAKSHDVRRG